MRCAFLNAMENGIPGGQNPCIDDIIAIKVFIYMI